MKIQTDQEILTDLIEQLNTTNDHENQKTILTDLEYYLHQVKIIERQSLIWLQFSMIMQYYLLI